jgi:transcriptional regulator with XRE-family HTH domain
VKLWPGVDPSGYSWPVQTESVGPSTPDDVPGHHVTVNQLIAYNMARWRKAAGLTQAELGERIGGWSGATVSAAERSWDGKRIRQFTADEIVAIALELGVPVPAMFLPPEGDGAAIRYLFHAHDRGAACSDMGDLFALLLPESGDAGLAGDAWQKAFDSAVDRYLDEERGEELLASLGEWSDEQARAARLERIQSQREVALSWVTDLDRMALALHRKNRGDDQEAGA